MDAFLELRGYAPDAAPTVPGILLVASGVVPSLRGLKGAPTPTVTTLPALTAACIGSAVITKLDGTTRMFAGTTTHLYEAGDDDWTDVSGATYTAATTARWRFAQQEDVTLAANGSDKIQRSDGTGAFADIAAAPIAKIVEVVNEFVFALNTSISTIEIKWSALGDYTDWTTSIATQSGSDTVEESPGPITAGKRFGNALVVFKKQSMFLGSYTGAPNIWEFALLPGNAGALSQEAVVNIGTAENPKLIFMGEDDFYLYDGSRPIPIGTNRVKNEVFSAIFQTRTSACSALHDQKNNLVYFYYPTVDSANPNACRVYNYRTDRWGVDDRQIEATTDFVAPAVTYGGLGDLYATYADLPDLPYGVALVGVTQGFPAIFDTSHLLKTLTGPAGDTTITTGDMGDDQQFSSLTRVVPRFIRAPTTASMTNFYKNRSGDSLETGEVTELTRGKFDVMRSARWHRLQFSFNGDWELSGISPEWVMDGFN